MNGSLAWSLLRSALFGLAAFAAVSHLLLLVSAGVPPWLLPLALLAGAWCGVASRASAGLEGPAAPRWLAAACTLALIATAVALMYGALATADREWDGAVSWTLKARALLAEPSLRQPLFAEPSVYLHSADYPLLQPLLLASAMHWLGEDGGRLLFPALWLAMVALCGLTLVRAGTDRRVAWLMALALGLTPGLVKPAGGAVDSGYADSFVTALLTAAGAGLLLGDPALLAAAAFCLPLAKPEGTVYAALLGCVTLFAGSRRNHVAVVLAGTAALLLWLPVRARLGGGENAGAWLLALPPLAVSALLAQELVRRRAWLPAACIAAGGALVLGWLAAHPGDGALAMHLQGFASVGGKLRHLPEILLGLLACAFAPDQLGLLFPLLLLLLLRPAGCPRPLAATFCLGMVAVASAFLLAPEQDVQHHLRSSAPRLLEQWCGIGWLLAGAWFGVPLAAAAAMDRRTATADTSLPYRKDLP